MFLFVLTYIALTVSLYFTSLYLTRLTLFLIFIFTFIFTLTFRAMPYACFQIAYHPVYGRNENETIR